jgi:cytoskeleton protein RodZ
MTDVGSQLRAAREAQGLTIAQAFKATRIKSVYLEALEANRIGALPGPVQARGFVRSYANYLGLNGETLASTLDASGPVMPVVAPPVVKPAAPVAVKPLSPAPDRSVPRPARSIELPSIPKISLGGNRDTAAASPGGIPTSVLIIGAIVLFLVGAALIISALTSGTQPLPTPDSNVPLSGESRVASVLSVPAQVSAGPVSLTLTASEHVWLRVSRDGQTAFEGLMKPDETRDWIAVDQVIVETGNAAALQVDARTRSGVLGERGQIVARVWSRSGSEDVPPGAALNGLSVPSVTLFSSIQRP